MDAYEAFVEKLEAGGSEGGGFEAAQAELGVREEGVDELTTLLMLQLRTKDGVDAEHLRSRLGEPYPYP